MEGDASVDRENCNFLPMEIFVLSIQRIKFIDKKIIILQNYVGSL